jgi:anti-sigma regulatory factor (Ser/Thr protein kinase)
MTTHPAIPPSLALPEGPGTRFAACALGGDLHAAGAARQFTRSTLRRWGMPEVVDNASIVVSEMLTNAVRYGLDNPSDVQLSSRPLWLGLLRRGPSVLCTVSDPGTEVPVVKEPDVLAENGRGLHIIDSLSESWGWTPPDNAGKSVWAMISGRG